MGRLIIAATAVLLGTSWPARAAETPLPVLRPAPAGGIHGVLPIPRLRPEEAPLGSYRSIPLPQARPQLAVGKMAALPHLAAGDRSRLEQAFQAAKSGKWRRARSLAGKTSSSIGRKLIDWLYLSDRATRIDFETLARFIDANPDWPKRNTLLLKAEAAMGRSTGFDRRLAWFAAHPPKSGVGKIRFAEALFANNKDSKAADLVRDAWINNNFPARDEKNIYRQYRRHLSEADHLARLDRLLWQGNYYSTKRQIRRVNADWRLLADARMTLRRRGGGVDRAVARVPESLKNDPGLVFERTRWRRRKRLHDSARELLLASEPGVPAAREKGHPELWWTERNFQVRRTLREDRIGDAYRLASEHHLEYGPDFAEAEWLSGWIALRYLNEPEKAYHHFSRLFEAVRTPISIARAAYWSGRAAEAYGEAGVAARWYADAAKHATAFYGQLAMSRLPEGRAVILTAEPGPTADEVSAFNEQELVQVTRLLAHLDQSEQLKPFVLKIHELAESPGSQALAANFAQSLGRTDFAVQLAKRSLRNGVLLAERAYPVVELPPNILGDGPEEDVILALVRQESAFDAKAHSHAGAWGMMQLMPATAKTVARQHNLAYTLQRLKEADFNITLGRAYLADLLKKYDGSLILALASYNAGSNRADRWMRERGDPRYTDVDPIDWIESIPFEETRNYVQRVLENLQVYRQRLNKVQEPVRLAQDLSRGARPSQYFVRPLERPQRVGSIAGEYKGE